MHILDGHLAEWLEGEKIVCNRAQTGVVMMQYVDFDNNSQLLHALECSTLPR